MNTGGSGGDSASGAGAGGGGGGSSGSGFAAAAVSNEVIHQSELNRLVKQLHDLREALRPFAVFGDALPAVIEGQPRITDAGPAFACKSPRDPMGEERVITFADLRRALALLTRLESEDEKRFIERVERKMAGVSDTCTALDCHQPIPGAEPHHLRGFCSERCELVALAWSKKNGGL